MAEPPLIEAREVSKSFQIPAVRRETVREYVLGFFQPPPSETLRVLREVSLDVRRGETVGIMGRNGSGKSTLLKILCGIYEADSGSVVVRAPVTPILELGIGWNPELDAVDNVLVLATVMGMSLGEARASVEEILVVRRIGKIRQPGAEALLERHGLSARVLGGLQGRARGARARRDLCRGRCRLQGAL